MNNQDYLNQITAQAQAKTGKKSQNSLFSPLMIKLAATGIILAIAIIIVGSLLGGVATKDRTLTEQIIARSTNLQTIIKDFNKSAKSATLRSLATALSGVLIDTNRDLTAALTSDFNYDSESSDTSITESEAALYAELNNTLEDSRLNGILDSAYARELTLQIALIQALESEASERTDSEALKTALDKSHSSLSSLYASFSNFNSTLE